MSSIQYQHLKEITMNQLCLPIEIIDIIKSFTFYDINTANEIKKTKTHQKQVNRLLREVKYSNYKTTLERMSLEMDEDNMIFKPNEKLRFGFILHSTETVYIESYNCLQCGNYMSTLYASAIQCKCNRQMQIFNLPAFFV